MKLNQILLGISLKFSIKHTWNMSETQTYDLRFHLKIWKNTANSKQCERTEPKRSKRKVLFFRILYDCMTQALQFSTSKSSKCKLQTQTHIFVFVKLFDQNCVWFVILFSIQQTNKKERKEMEKICYFIHI